MTAVDDGEEEKKKKKKKADVQHAPFPMRHCGSPHGMLSRTAATLCPHSGFSALPLSLLTTPLFGLSS